MGPEVSPGGFSLLIATRSEQIFWGSIMAILRSHQAFFCARNSAKSRESECALVQAFQELLLEKFVNDNEEETGRYGLLAVRVGNDTGNSGSCRISGIINDLPERREFCKFLRPVLLEP